MKKQKIAIIGPIGSFEYRGQLISGVQLDDIIAQVTQLPAGTTELEIEVATPGGSVAVGKAIYSYLKFLNTKFEKVVMKQIGDIASIGTYFWFASPIRKAAKGINPQTGNPYGFNVHNPWNPHTEGDAAAHEEEAVRLRISENEMAEFYSENMGIPMEGILPLMSVNAKFDADRAVELKFATETYEALNQAAYTPMTDKEKKSYLQELLASIKNWAKEGTVAAEPPAPPAPPAATPPADNGPVGKPVLIDGVAPVDGVYTIIAGVVTELKPVAPAAPAATPPPAPAPVSLEVAFEANQEKLSAMFATTLDKALAAQKAAFDAEMVEVKKQIKTVHSPAGFVPENRTDDVAEWHRSRKANEHAAMKRDDPAKYRRLFYAVYNKEPEM